VPEGLAKVLRWLRAGSAFALLLAVYIPTFTLVTALRLSVAQSVPVIILVSATLALTFMLVLRGRGTTLAEFGMRWSGWRYLIGALAVGVPVAAVVSGLLSQTHESGPLAGLSLAPALAWLYFGLGSPLQEELIFRGLLLTVLTRNFSTSVETSARAGAAAVVGAAVLFALVHLAVGPWTAVAALVLGLLAGELRRRSGSVIPAVLVHIIFNLPGLLMAAHT